MPRYTDRECLDALRLAASEVQGNLSELKYDKLDIKPDSATLEYRFGPWNKAKSEAGLDTTEAPHPGSTHDYREVSESKLKCVRWYINKKESGYCERCGETDERSLQFHHKSDKKFSISQSVTNDEISLDNIRDEFEKCELICANCHRAEHGSWPPQQLKRFL